MCKTTDSVPYISNMKIKISSLNCCVPTDAASPQRTQLSLSPVNGNIHVFVLFGDIPFATSSSLLLSLPYTLKDMGNTSSETSLSSDPAYKTLRRLTDISSAMQQKYYERNFEELVKQLAMWTQVYGTSVAPMLGPTVDYATLSQNVQDTVTVRQNPLYEAWLRTYQAHQKLYSTRSESMNTCREEPSSVNSAHHVEEVSSRGSLLFPASPSSSSSSSSIDTTTLSTQHLSVSLDPASVGNVNSFTDEYFACRWNSHCWTEISYMHRVAAFFTNTIERQTSMCRVWSWAIPSPNVLDYMKDTGLPVVEVGAGTGYWLAQLHMRAIDCVGYDVLPSPADTQPPLLYNTDCTTTELRQVFATRANADKDDTTPEAYEDVRPAVYYHPVQKWVPSTVDWSSADMNRRALLLCWTPQTMRPGASMSYDALSMYKGNDVYYVGEGQASATSAFFELLNAEWMLVKRLDMPVWPGQYDLFYHYQRRRPIDGRPISVEPVQETTQHV